ncbi:hypothetical protein PR048_025962 [Dryococelus australis]|uniref:Uncharacterized protein n=1 Tax=Dryococelus australis TaxID=614101 RepID=A0ABQ9GK04_9NEOP|nr:hypothetical protein PR048_025962 [Dryococelus australis]
MRSMEMIILHKAEEHTTYTQLAYGAIPPLYAGLLCGAVMRRAGVHTSTQRALSRSRRRGGRDRARFCGIGCSRTDDAHQRGVFCVPSSLKRGSDKDDTAAHFKCAIAAKREAQNWRRGESHRPWLHECSDRSAAEKRSRSKLLMKTVHFERETTAIETRSKAVRSKISTFENPAYRLVNTFRWNCIRGMVSETNDVERTPPHTPINLSQLAPHWPSEAHTSSFITQNVVAIAVISPRTSWIAENVLEGTYLKYKYHLRGPLRRELLRAESLASRVTVGRFRSGEGRLQRSETVRRRACVQKISAELKAPRALSEGLGLSSQVSANVNSLKGANRFQIPGRVAPGFSHVGIEPDDAAGRRAFSGISHFPRFFHSSAAPYSPHFTLIGSQDLDVKRRSKISPDQRAKTSVLERCCGRLRRRVFKNARVQQPLMPRANLSRTRHQTGKHWPALCWNGIRQSAPADLLASGQTQPIGNLSQNAVVNQAQRARFQRLAQSITDWASPHQSNCHGLEECLLRSRHLGVYSKFLGGIYRQISMSISAFSFLPIWSKMYLNSYSKRTIGSRPPYLGNPRILPTNPPQLDSPPCWCSGRQRDEYKHTLEFSPYGYDLIVDVDAWLRKMVTRSIVICYSHKLAVGNIARFKGTYCFKYKNNCYKMREFGKRPGGIFAFYVEERWSDNGYTATYTKCGITSTSKALNWSAVVFAAVACDEVLQGKLVLGQCCTYLVHTAGTSNQGGAGESECTAITHERATMHSLNTCKFGVNNTVHSQTRTAKIWASNFAHKNDAKASTTDSFLRTVPIINLLHLQHCPRSWTLGLKGLNSAEQNEVIRVLHVYYKSRLLKGVSHERSSKCQAGERRVTIKLNKKHFAVTQCCRYVKNYFPSTITNQTGCMPLNVPIIIHAGRDSDITNQTGCMPPNVPIIIHAGRDSDITNQTGCMPPNVPIIIHAGRDSDITNQTGCMPLNVPIIIHAGRDSDITNQTGCMPLNVPIIIHAGRDSDITNQTGCMPLNVPIIIHAGRDSDIFQNGHRLYVSKGLGLHPWTRSHCTPSGFSVVTLWLQGRQHESVPLENPSLVGKPAASASRPGRGSFATPPRAATCFDYIILIKRGHDRVVVRLLTLHLGADLPLVRRRSGMREALGWNPEQGMGNVSVKAWKDENGNRCSTTECFEIGNIWSARPANARLHHRGSKLDPRSDLRSTQKTVAPFEFRIGLEIEMKSLSNRQFRRFEISIRDQQPSWLGRPYIAQYARLSMRDATRNGCDRISYAIVILALWLVAVALSDSCDARASPLKEAPWDICVTERGNEETTPKAVKGTGEDMLRDGIDSCDNVGLEFFKCVCGLLLSLGGHFQLLTLYVVVALVCITSFPHSVTHMYHGASFKGLILYKSVAPSYCHVLEVARPVSAVLRRRANVCLCMCVLVVRLHCSPSRIGMLRYHESIGAGIERGIEKMAPILSFRYRCHTKSIDTGPIAHKTLHLQNSGELWVAIRTALVEPRVFRKFIRGPGVPMSGKAWFGRFVAPKFDNASGMVKSVSPSFCHDTRLPTLQDHHIVQEITKRVRILSTPCLITETTSAAQKFTRVWLFDLVSVLAMVLAPQRPNHPFPDFGTHLENDQFPVPCNVLKNVHDNVNILEMNLSKNSLSLLAYNLMSALSDIRLAKLLVTMEGKAWVTMLPSSSALSAQTAVRRNTLITRSTAVNARKRDCERPHCAWETTTSAGCRHPLANFNDMQARLYSHMYTYADINCTLVVCCRSGKRQLDTVLQEVSNALVPERIREFFRSLLIEIWTDLIIEVLRADDREAKYGAASECKGGDNGDPRENPTQRASSGTIPACEKSGASPWESNPVRVIGRNQGVGHIRRIFAVELVTTRWFRAPVHHFAVNAR